MAIAGIFLLQVILPGSAGRWLDETFAFNPLNFLRGIETGESPVWLAVPLFGHMFLHGGVEHVLFNGIWLLIFGTGVARRLGVDFGDSSQRLYRNMLFLTFYLLCGLLAVTFYYALQPSSPIYLIGASGAISGLMGGSMRFVAISPRDAFGRAGRLAPLTAPPVLVVTLVFVAINLGTAVGVDSMTDNGPEIAWEAHIGGYFAGLLLFPLFDWLARKPL